MRNRLFPLLVLLLLPTSASADSDEWIVFSSGRSGDGDVYAIDPAGGEPQKLFGSPVGEGTVRYDAERERIVYHRYVGDRVLLTADDGVELFDDPNGDVAPHWSPTDDRIVYTAKRDGQDDLYLAKKDGGDERRLTDDPEIDRYPAFSPDGQSVVFAKRLESGWELFTLDLSADPPKATQRTHSQTYVGHPSWSGDGKKIVFDTMFGDQTEIALLDLASGEQTRLTRRDGNDLIAAVSYDGSWVAFGGEPEPGNWDLWIVDVKSKKIRRLTEAPSFDGAPVVVPAKVVLRRLREIETSSTKTDR